MRAPQRVSSDDYRREPSLRGARTGLRGAKFEIQETALAREETSGRTSRGIPVRVRLQLYFDVQKSPETPEYVPSWRSPANVSGVLDCVVVDAAEFNRSLPVLRRFAGKNPEKAGKRGDEGYETCRAHRHLAPIFPKQKAGRVSDGTGRTKINIRVLFNAATPLLVEYVCCGKLKNNSFKRRLPPQ